MQLLYLNDNRIGDPGMIKLSEALGHGALASLQMIGVDNKSHPQLVAACQRPKPRGIRIAA